MTAYSRFGQNTLSAVSESWGESMASLSHLAAAAAEDGHDRA
jgi:hypothetical protein